MLDEILGHPAGFGEEDGLGAVGGLDLHDGRFAEGVDLFELGGCEGGCLVAVEDLEGVGDFELLEEPDYALGAGLVEPGEVSTCCVFSLRAYDLPVQRNVGKF